jgi:hypothetical protein
MIDDTYDIPDWLFCLETGHVMEIIGRYWEVTSGYYKRNCLRQGFQRER